MNQSLDTVVSFDVQCLARLNHNAPRDFGMVVDALSSAGHVKGYFILKLLFARSGDVFAPNVSCTIVINIMIINDNNPSCAYSAVLDTHTHTHRCAY